MSPETYLRYAGIEREYGTLAAEYWHAVSNGSYAAADRIYKLVSKAEPALRGQVDEAKSANFRVPPDPEREGKLMSEYERLQGRYHSLLRRENFLERLKDSLVWIGLAAVLVFVGQKVVWNVPRDDRDVTRPKSGCHRSPVHAANARQAADKTEVGAAEATNASVAGARREGVMKKLHKP